MKVSELKNTIKQAVREAIQEELRDILLEAVKSPKVSVGNGSYGQVTETVLHSEPKVNPAEVRSRYQDLVGSMARNQENFSFNSSHAAGFSSTQAYRPPASANTTGEGSSLPMGEVSLDQIMGLMHK